MEALNIWLTAIAGRLGTAGRTERGERLNDLNGRDGRTGRAATGRAVCPGLRQAVEAGARGQAAALLKHLDAAGIKGWRDLTKAGLYAFRDRLLETVAPSSAKTYLAVLRAVLHRWEEDAPLPCRDWEDTLKARNDRPVRVHLDPDELGRLERTETGTSGERLAKLLFLTCAWTGMRMSDAVAAGPENIRGGVLRYVSIKTGRHVEVPCRPGVADWLGEIRRAGGFSMTTAGYNKTLRRLCRRAGICSEVKVRRGGKDYTAEKWECVSGHTARISFCTNLAVAGVPLCDIKLLAGHTSESMTERYIAVHTPKLGSRALELLTGKDE